MKPTLQATRSIGAEFAQRLYRPVLITAAIIAAVLLALSIWLVTINEWWVLLLVLVCAYILVAGAAFTIIWLVIRAVSPYQTKTQRRQTRQFVDKLQRVAETAATPKFVLLFQVVRDVVSPRQNGFIASISSDTSSLKNDFMDIRDSFKSNKGE